MVQITWHTVFPTGVGMNCTLGAINFSQTQVRVARSCTPA